MHIFRNHVFFSPLKNTKEHVSLDFSAHAGGKVSSKVFLNELKWFKFMVGLICVHTVASLIREKLHFFHSRLFFRLHSFAENDHVIEYVQHNVTVGLNGAFQHLPGQLT